MKTQINKAFKQAENYIKEVTNELRNLQIQLVLSQNTGNLEML
jgi:hypothetical protein